MEQPASAVAALGSKKRRRAPSAPQDPAEAARRYQQRKLREEALKARAQGQGFVPNKKRKFDARAPSQGPPADRPNHGSSAKPGRGFTSDRGGQAPDEDAGSRPMTKVKVIIVPIYWNRKREEKAQVLAAAGRVEKVVKDAGVTCGIDSTNKLTPGQKFRFWEERHVKIRVELGPKEAAAGQCVVAKCKKPGAVAAKTTVRIGPALVDFVKPVVPEEPNGEGTTADGDSAGINAWDADPEEAEDGKGKQKSKTDKEAKKLLKKRAKQLQKEAAAAQQGTTALERKALGLPVIGEASPAADSHPEEPSEPRPKKVKKQKVAAELAAALGPATQMQPAADVNRWDADPEAADAAGTDGQLPDCLYANAAGVAPSQKKAVNKKLKAAKQNAKPSTADPVPANGAAPAHVVDINRWDADPEALEGLGPELDVPNGVSSETQADGALQMMAGSPAAGKKQARPSKLQPVAGVSGDDLGDEFDIAVEEEEEGVKKKKGKKKQAALGGRSEQLPVWQADGAPKPKQLKQVVF